MNIFNPHMSETCNNLIDIIPISISSQNLLQVTLKSYLLLLFMVQLQYKMIRACMYCRCYKMYSFSQSTDMCANDISKAIKIRFIKYLCFIQIHISALVIYTNNKIFYQVQSEECARLLDHFMVTFLCWIWRGCASNRLRAWPGGGCPC